MSGRRKMTEDIMEGDLRPLNIAVIKEVYDSEYALVKFEMEFERALEAEYAIIVIEPERLGEETSRWITIGNSLHKISLYSGLISICAGLASERLYCAPFGILSLLSASCYTLSWQWDPCCKYQREKNPKRFAHLPMLTELNSASPLVLVRTDNTRKVALHCTVSLAAALICIWRVYRVFK